MKCPSHSKVATKFWSYNRFRTSKRNQSTECDFAKTTYTDRAKSAKKQRKITKR